MKKFFKDGDRLFYLMITVILTLVFLIVLYPCIYVVAASFSSGSAVQAGKVFLWPVDFSFDGYLTVFSNMKVWIGYANSLFYTVVGTVINVVVTIMAAYALSRRDLPGRNAIMMFFTFTMIFGGGMIPNYLLIKNLGMLNTRWALLLPNAIKVYNMIMARTFIQNSIPEELLEASKMDGCSDFRYMMQVVIPLSKAIIAVLVLLYGVAHWNQYFNAMLYLNDQNLYPLQVFLREILQANTIDPTSIADPELQMRLAEMANVMKYALIVVSMIPVMLIYPLIQKHFVEGVMIGSVKG